MLRHPGSAVLLFQTPESILIIVEEAFSVTTVCEPPMNKFTCFLMRLAPQATVGSRTWSPNDKPYPLARSPFRIIPATGQVPYSMCTAEHCTQQSSPAGLPASTQCMPSALSASAGLHRHMWFYAALQELLPPVQTAPLPERVLIFPGCNYSAPHEFSQNQDGEFTHRTIIENSWGGQGAKHL